MLRKLSGLFVLILFSAAAVFAQTHTATVSGEVKDSSGAMIPGANVTVHNIETNLKNVVPTNGEGRFAVPNLIPGNYEVTVESPGMRRLERTGLVLQVGDNVSLDLTLQVGNQTQLVTVTGQTPLLRTADAESGLVVDQRRIEELPEYDRNPLAFALLTPNVNNVNSEESGYGSDFRINGGRTAQSEYYVDGIPVSTGYEHNIPPGVPGMEAVSEFKVITNGMSAEYGRLSGGAVTMVTKSGTNDLHGSAYEFFQNQVLNASDWNSNRLGVQKGAFHNNIYGFSVGGPVYLPKVYNGRNKTFFFLNYEGTKYNIGSNSATMGVPTDNEKNGDFSQTPNFAGTAIVQISDPLTGVLDPTTGIITRTPFTNDTIPGDRIDPLSKIYLGLYPEANRASLAGSTHNQNWVGAQGTTETLGLWTGRFDENWNSKNTTHFSYIESNSTYGQTSLSPAVPYSFSTTGGSTITLEHDYTINPTTVLTLRAGLVRYVVTSGTAVSDSLDSSGRNLQSYVADLIGTNKGRIPQMIADNDYVTALGNGSGISNDYETDFTFLGSVHSQFARFPAAQPVRSDLNEVTREALAIFRGRLHASTDAPASPPTFPPSTWTATSSSASW